jgi:hypothetical protein
MKCSLCPREALRGLLCDVCRDGPPPDELAALRRLAKIARISGHHLTSGRARRVEVSVEDLMVAIEVLERELGEEMLR